MHDATAWWSSDLRTADESESGMTLVELLVTLIALGILASIVALGVSPFRDQAVESTCAADRTAVVSAADFYATQKGSYPASIEDLLSDPQYLKNKPSGTYLFDTENRTVTQTSCRAQS